MRDNIHEPIYKSNEYTEDGERRLGCLFICLMIIALILLGHAAYWLVINWRTYWPISAMLIFIALFPALGAYIVHPNTFRHVHEYRFKMDEEGIFESHVDLKQGTKDSVHIPFENIYKVVVGNYAERVIVPRGVNYYRFKALMMIHFDDDIYFHLFSDQEEFADWMCRLIDKKCPLYRTHNDLYQAYADRFTHHVDFSQIKTETWDEETIYPSIGEEKVYNPFHPWDHGGAMRKDVKDHQKKQLTKWTKRVAGLLFIYAIIVGSIIIPTRPLDRDGFIEFDGVILFGVCLVYILIPFIFLYWRRHVKWYLPFVLSLIALSGSMVGFFVSSLFNDFPQLYGSIGLLNLFTLVFGWIPAFLIFPSIRGIHKLNKLLQRK